MNRPRLKPPHRSAPAPAAAGAPEVLLFTLVETAEAVGARMEAAVSPVGLSLPKLAVLHILAEAREPLPLSALATRQHCVRSNITQLVDRLEADGLVRRRADPEDGRGIRASLTPAGARVHREGMRALVAEQRAIMKSLGAGDAAKLRGVLELLGR